MKQELNPCRYCSTAAKQWTHEDRNYLGEKGFVSTIKCLWCRNSVSAFGKTPEEAEKKAAGYWNRGIYDLA